MAKRRRTLRGGHGGRGRTRKPRKGKRMRHGAKWRLTSRKGKGRSFAATLLTTINMGSRRLALFSVPKRFHDG